MTGQWRRRDLLAVLVVVGALLLTGAAVVRGLVGGGGRAAATVAPIAPSGRSAPRGELRFERFTTPNRTIVRDADGEGVAVLTDGSRSVRLTGPVRTFKEPRFTAHVVRTDAWVRLLPRAWRADAAGSRWFRSWLTRARRDRSPDVLAVAMEYVDGAPAHRDRDGVRYTGDADYGPLSEEDTDGRLEDSDFTDYLGVRWRFPDGTLIPPRRVRYGAADCSGYLRLVYGYRLGVPMWARDEAHAGGLPRTAVEMAHHGGGTVIAQRADGPPPLDQLAEGDLVFFKTDPDDPEDVNHSGLYLGPDEAGHPRFLSSRTRANGPTFGDLGGASVLDGRGLYARGLRLIRRL